MLAAVVDPVAAAAFSSFSINCLKIVCHLKIHNRDKYTVLLSVNGSVQA